jgi:hypothetical protein
MSEQDRPSEESFPGLAQRREKTIDILTRCYSDDLLSVTEFERRVESAHSAANYRELEDLVVDLPAEYRRAITPAEPGPTAPPHAPRPPAAGAMPRVSAVLAEREVTGEIFEAGFGSAVAVMGTLDIDLDESQLVGTELTLHVFGLMSDINLTVPKETRVELELTPILADIKLKGQNTPKSVAARTIHVTGMAIMSDVKIRR